MLRTKLLSTTSVRAPHALDCRCLSLPWCPAEAVRRKQLALPRRQRMDPPAASASASAVKHIEPGASEPGKETLHEAVSEELTTLTDRTGEQGQQKKHLVLLVNGLFGNVDNWAVVKAKVEERTDASDLLLVASTVNSRFKTFEGIDSCGKRLAEEVREYVDQTPGLERISVIGHSMGGLISRYVIGLLYDPQTELICGLRPAHFITLATPHLGCAEVEGPSQVPFMAWMGAMPVMGGSMQRVLQASTRPLASLAMAATGAQFFLNDRAGLSAEGASIEAVPLLVRMTQDIPAEGYFYSALSSFVSRTCYANTHGDHLVGWANSSLRRLDQLPALPALAASARGVVLEDPLGASLAPSLRGVSRGNSEDHGPQGGSPLGAALRENDQRGAAALQGGSEDSQCASLLQAGSGGAHVPPAQASHGCSEGSRQDMQGLGRSGAGSGLHSSSGRAPRVPLVKNISGPGGPLGALRFSSSSSGAAGAQRRGDAADALAGEGADGGWSGGWTSGALIQRGLELMQNAQVSGAGLAERLSGGRAAGADGGGNGSGGAWEGRGGGGGARGAGEGTGPSGDALDGVAVIERTGDGDGGERARESLQGSPAGGGGEVSAQTAAMLERLQALPWRRVDVSFRGTSMPFFAHNLIQVTRKWLNWEGEAVAEHLAGELAALEADPRVRGALQ